MYIVHLSEYGLLELWVKRELTVLRIESMLYYIYLHRFREILLSDCTICRVDGYRFISGIQAVASKFTLYEYIYIGSVDLPYGTSLSY